VDVEELLGRAGDHLGARRVFGAPLERDGVTVVPVAMVVGGGGGGGGRGSDGADGGGAGFGGISRAVGVYTIRDGEVRFVPATDRTLLIALVVLVWWRVAVGALRRRR
jgi:uncharacterized spore protein YtfJ